MRVHSVESDKVTTAQLQEQAKTISESASKANDKILAALACENIRSEISKLVLRKYETFKDVVTQTPQVKV